MKGRRIQPITRASSQVRPRLSSEIERQLAVIEPSICGSLKYLPCSVVLKTGGQLDCVYFVSQAGYIRYWGIYPEDDTAKHSVLVQDVQAIGESPHRLPVSIANTLYKSGESGMGYTVFTLEFVDGSTQAYVTGNAVDFVDYPDHKTASDVVRVLPHVGRDSNPRQGRAYYWCLYSDDDTERAARLGLTDPLPRARQSWLTKFKTLAKRFRRGH